MVLTNAEAGAAFNAITYRVLDAYIGAPSTRLAGGVRRRGATRQRADADDELARSTSRSATRRSKPSLPLAGYAGTYRDPWYGDVVVAARAATACACSSRQTPRAARAGWSTGSTTASSCAGTTRWLNADAFVDFDLDHDGAIRDGADAAGVAADRFQLRFPGPAAGAGGALRPGPVDRSPRVASRHAPARHRMLGRPSRSRP